MTEQFMAFKSPETNQTPPSLTDKELSPRSKDLVREVTCLNTLIGH